MPAHRNTRRETQAIAALQDLFESGGDLFTVSTGAGALRAVNPAWTAATGWTAEELVGQPMSALIHPDDVHILEAPPIAVCDPSDGHGLVRIRLKGGGYRWCERRNRHEFAAGTVTILRDVTADRAREAELGEALRMQAMLAETASVGAWSYEPVDDEIWWWPGMLALTGWTQAEIGAPEDFLAKLHPEDEPAARKAFGEGVAKGRSGSVDHRIRTRDGRWVVLRATFRAEAREGWRHAMKGISQDITALVAARDEARAAACELERALAAAQAASEAKADFLANMSHEIRTPMNGVLGVLHLLREESLTPDGAELLREATICGRMLSQLLNDILDFSKIEAGLLELTREPVSTRDLVDSVVNLLRPDADARNLDLRVEMGRTPEWVFGDPVRLRQALFNLAGNAVKFTLEGSVTVRVVSVKRKGATRLRFEVVDTGVGIAEDAQAGMFGRFHQADASTTRRFGGSGLGLAITRTLAELMGGEVGFTSVLGAGSTFWMEVAAEVAAAPAPAVDTTAQASVLAGLRILVVEDNATNRLIATKLLESVEAEVTTAENGVLGVRAATTGGFDLVLMDVQMPDIDGVEATRRIRALNGSAGRTPIIALTANVMAHQNEAYAAAGMNGMVGKPISPGALYAEIVRVMERAGLEPERAVAVG